jgi:hypothetical protein
MSRSALTIAQAFRDHRLFAAALGVLSSWQTWLTVLGAAFALPLTAEQMQTFAAISGGRLPPSKAVRELWVIAGRRSGKSRMAALIACFIALFVKHKAAPGERPMVLVIAGSVEQANTVFGYVKGFLEASRVLAKEVAGIKRHEIELHNGVVIAVHSNSFRTVRGRTLAAVVFDEVSFWRDEATSTPDVETYTAVLPALATTHGMLIGISTPYRKLGLLHQKWRDHYGQDCNDVLVVQGASKVFNSSLSDTAIEALRAADPTAAASEWDAEFRPDVAAFLDDALIDGAVDHGRPLELPPQGGIQYKAFADSAGGRGDAHTFAIGHKSGEHFVIDVLRGTHPPFDPVETTRQYAALAKQYRVNAVPRDHYAAEWVSAAWRDCGITCNRSELPKSSIYLETLPLFARGVVRLPDHPKLLRELRLLERHSHRSGRDIISHSRTGSDDYANAALGTLQLLAVSGPALWRAESFAVRSTMAAAPLRADFIFATMVVDKGGAVGVGYFAASLMPGSPLTVLDVDLATLSPALFQNMATRLVDFAKVMLYVVRTFRTLGLTL